MTVTASEIKCVEGDVWPKLRKNSNVAVVAWSESLVSHHLDGFTRVITGESAQLAIRKSAPIHGIRLVIEAEDGEEDVRVVENENNKYLHLQSSRHWITLENRQSDCRGRGGIGVAGRVYDAVFPEPTPLPRGTKTTIDLTNGSVELVGVEEPKFPYHLGDEVWLYKADQGYEFRLGRNEDVIYPSVTTKQMDQAKAYIDSVEGA